MTGEPHIDSGVQCLVAHNIVKPEPQCVKCLACGEWVRPEKMDEECPGRQQDGREG